MQAPYGRIVEAREDAASEASFTKNQQLSTRFGEISFELPASRTRAQETAGALETTQEKTSERSRVRGKQNEMMVGVRGFEPPASTSRT